MDTETNNKDFIRIGNFNFCLPYYVPVKVPLREGKTVFDIILAKYGSALLSANNDNNNNNNNDDANVQAKRKLQATKEFCEKMIHKGKMYLVNEKIPGHQKISLVAEKSSVRRDRKDDEAANNNNNSSDENPSSLCISESFKPLLFTESKQHDFKLVILSHYHEPPTLASSSSSSSSIQILKELFLGTTTTNDNNTNVIKLFAVNKPQSLLVHAGGKYHKSTVEYLWKQQTAKNCSSSASSSSSSFSLFYPCHRLDKGTSGVLLIATDGKSAQRVGELMMSKSDEDSYRRGRSSDESGEENNNADNSSSSSPPKIQKEYLARVYGKLDFGIKDHDDTDNRDFWLTVDRSIYQCLTKDDNFMKCLDTEELEMKAREYRFKNNDIKNAEKQNENSLKIQSLPLATDDPVTHAKWAVTKFKIVSYCSKSDTSLVLCRPVTGRTHQIRVHLAQVLGHPIVNDDGFKNKFNNNNNHHHGDGVISNNNGDTSSSSLASTSLTQTYAVPGVDFETCDECPTCQNLLLRQQNNNNRSLEDQFQFGSPMLNLHSYRYYFINCCGGGDRHGEEKEEDVTVVVEAPIPEWAKVE